MLYGMDITELVKRNNSARAQYEHLAFCIAQIRGLQAIGQLPAELDEHQALLPPSTTERESPVSLIRLGPDRKTPGFACARHDGPHSVSL